jgi:hypothetical protein
VCLPLCFLLQGHLNADEQRQVDMLRRRLELHDEVYNRRLKREQYAKQRAGLIKRYIGTTGVDAPATNRPDLYSRSVCAVKDVL